MTTETSKRSPKFATAQEVDIMHGNYKDVSDVVWEYFLIGCVRMA